MRKATEIQDDLRLLRLRKMHGVATGLFYETKNAATQEDAKMKHRDTTKLVSWTNFSSLTLLDTKIISYVTLKNEILKA